jgi:hypothetical protein
MSLARRRKAKAAQANRFTNPAPSPSANDVSTNYNAEQDCSLRSMRLWHE